MISVVLATYNEEKNLKRCLESVTNFADEVVVVDGSSTDQTATIARAMGARVITTSNKANFHINKQMAMDAAHGELILQLDADEVVDPQLADFIVATSSRLDSLSEKAWYLKRKNFFLGTFLRKGGQYPDPVIRLYRRGYARLPQRDIHEQMVVDGRVGTAPGHLIHYANPTFADYLRKFDTYTSFKARQLKTAHVRMTWPNSFKYLCYLPLKTTLQLWLRHKGFQDGVAGFVFAVMSGCHHAIAYLKVWELEMRS